MVSTESERTHGGYFAFKPYIPCQAGDGFWTRSFKRALRKIPNFHGNSGSVLLCLDGQEELSPYSVHQDFVSEAVKGFDVD